ncbi:MAG TPA: DUF2975 domain-containing protein [Firmicutes bacterium]|jgi:hypothetical protein|nr:DUF2975 domain-containing protein [Bacillota bacterium]
MEYLGEKSVSSVLLSIIRVIWIIGLVAIGILIFIILIGVFKPNWLDLVESGTFTLNALGMRITFTDPAYKQLMLPLYLRFFGWVGLPLLAMSLYVIHQLKAVLGALCRNNPFAAENAEHMRNIGVAIIAWTVYQSIAYLIVGWYIARQIQIAGMTINPAFTFDATLLFVGLVVLVLAQVFKVGIQLREDQELTI